MPKRKRISEETFSRIVEYGKSHGGKILGQSEKKDIYRSIGLIPPDRKKKNLSEVGMLFWVKGLLVYAWTSFVMKTMEDNWEDHGWILIVCKESPSKYFATPTRRTENFEKNFLERLEITLAHAHGRPLCDKCHKFMTIFKKRDGSTMWACFNKSSHEKPRFQDWDTGLSDEQKKITTKSREIRKKYRDENKKKNIVRTPAKQIRKKWKISRPENQP